MTTAAASMFEDRSDPGRVLSALLAAAMHAVLLLILIFGVRWQNRPPEAVQVELWNPPAEAPPAEAPKPVPKVEPPAVVKPEPVPPKPEIVEQKAPPPKPLPKIEPKPEPKPVAKAEPKQKPAPPKPVAKAAPLKRRVDETKRFQEEAAREQASLALDREHRRIRDQLARDAAAASSKALAGWIDKIKIKIRSNIVLPQGIQGNPEAIFDVVQLPTGDILSVKLRKSSGVPALDNAIERAVLKSSPLPRPDAGVAVPREFELKYKPLD
jgi:colicin import membrane protein